MFFPFERFQGRSFQLVLRLDDVALQRCRSKSTKLIALTRCLH